MRHTQASPAYPRGAGGATAAESAAPVAPATASAAPAPHAPETGWARRLLGRFHVTGVFWYRFHGWGARSWPSSQMWMIIAPFTTFFFFTLIKIRGALAHNLEAVLGPCGWVRRQARIYRTMWVFAWCLTERYERLQTARPFAIRAAREELWSELCGTGGGFIMVTAHLGNWEVGSLLPVSAEARVIHVVREAEADPRAQEYISGLIAKQGRGGLYVTHFAEDPQLGMQLLDALRRGEIVALQGDRPRAGGRFAAVRLFGRPFPLPVGPVALARAAGVPLLPVFVFREGRRRYRCEIRPPIAVPPADERPDGVDEALHRFAAELERAIASEPHQWFCFRRLWR
ncbi:MAG TPA: lysophospholipid acyltransferase family protein [Thermoanaerobaculia bacterium]|nr:lysophospholipid acyltransferase family protein [Thermoanaerobaculia bacterium]